MNWHPQNFSLTGFAGSIVVMCRHPKNAVIQSRAVGMVKEQAVRSPAFRRKVSAFGPAAGHQPSQYLKGEHPMIIDSTDHRNSTRRGFVQNLTAGAAGMTFFSALTSLSTPALAVQEAKPKIPPGAGLANLENVKHAKTLVELKPWRSVFPSITAPMITALGPKDIPESRLAIGFAHIVAPGNYSGPAHKHAFDHYIWMIGTSDNFVGIDADMEFQLDGVNHQINYPFYAFIPKGMSHCPLIVKRIGKPLIFIDARLMDPGTTEGPERL
jgi:hypothetical protein